MNFLCGLIFISLLVVLAATCDTITLQEITSTVQQHLTATGTSNGGETYLTDNPQATRHLFEEVENVLEYVNEGLSNGSSLCSVAWNLLSAETQRISYSPARSVTVYKNTVALDACGKPVPEILRGNIRFKGGFDECMQLDTSSHNFTMKYAEVDLIFVYVENDSIVTQFPICVKESLCIPDVCTFLDINNSFTAINEETLALPIPNKVLIYATTLQTKAVQSDIPLSYSTGAIVMIAISCLFVCFAILGSAYDLLLPYYVKLYYGSNTILDKDYNPLFIHGFKTSRWKAFVLDALQSFSLYKTIPDVMSTAQPSSAITSINGLRVITMFWVILGHSYYFPFLFGEYKNQIDLVPNFISRFSAQSIVNANCAVDSFFFLSGLLVAYLTLHEMSRKNGRFPFLSFYVHRFLRLTPTYMFVLFFYWFLAVHITNGPGMQDIFGEHSVYYKRCEEYWWTNLLYVNNFYPKKFEDQCMAWTWYLANNMQFYLISPLFLIPLFLSLASGLVALITTLLVSIGVTGFIAGYYDYPANSFYNLVNNVDPLRPNLPDQLSEIFGKPYCRIMPYLVGIFLGHVFYKKYQVSFHNAFMNLILYGVLWIVAGIIGIATLYGLYTSFHGHEFTVAENILYFMLSRFAWGATLFLIVYACHNGYGGAVNRFLSLPIWIPLSRLTFTTYLMHEVVLLLLVGEMRDSIYFTDMNMVVHVLPNTILSFAVAAVVSVFVEFPLSNLERAVFKLFGKPLRARSKITSGEWTD